MRIENVMQPDALNGDAAVEPADAGCFVVREQADPESDLIQPAEQSNHLFIGIVSVFHKGIVDIVDQSPVALPVK